MKHVLHKLIPDGFAPNVPALIVGTLEGEKLSMSAHPVNGLGDIMGNEFPALPDPVQVALAIEFGRDLKELAKSQEEN